jgi:hypothetical protein
MAKARKFQDTFPYAKCQDTKEQEEQKPDSIHSTHNTHTQAHKSLPIVVCYGPGLCSLFELIIRRRRRQQAVLGRNQLVTNGMRASIAALDL